MAKAPLVGIIMGSDSDLDIMGEAAKVLESFGVPHEVRVVSAHRTPDIMSQYAHEAADRGLKVIIAGAGGSAHLPGMTASETTLPTIAVPIKRPHHNHEAFWSNIKMPSGIALATMPENGAKNAALLAIEILSLSDPGLGKKYAVYRQKLHDDVITADNKLQQQGWQKYLEDTN
ncbi:MAG TPA: 5-(carboxyamino)imidazole ribonucleotide mutase [Patescibacteria group bacterium]|nr:5-(carboxyamino)imidazole ribonucleotide mutase [Patescibacteria group bacterium]